MFTIVTKASGGVAILLVIATTGLAMNGGSGYSRYGIGDVRYFPSGRAMGMGGVNLAILGVHEVNRFNPAAWTNLKRTNFSGTFFYEGFSTDDGENSAYLSSAKFNGMMLAIPIATSRGIVLAGGFNPYSSVNYDIATSVSESGTDSDVRYTGKGGLSSALVGLSYAPTPKLHLGVQTQYLFGTIDNSWNINFLSNNPLSSEARRMTEYRGFQFAFGVIHSAIGSWIGLSQRHELSIGVNVTTPTDLTVQRQTLTVQPQTPLSNVILSDTSELVKGIAYIPARFGLGAAMKIDGRYLIGTDVFYQKWNSYEEFGIHPIELRNSLRLSIGFERLTAPEPTSFGDRVAYRFGFAYHATYYRVKNEPLDEIFISAGLGIPLGLGTRANFAVEYGIRGTTDNQLQQDNILRFMLTVNVRELWFIRAPEE